MPVFALAGIAPALGADVFVAPTASVIGDVVIGEDSSVWPCTVIRGDVHHIRIGARTNIQDGCVLHVMRDEHPLVLGDDGQGRALYLFVGRIVRRAGA